jgi:hypothetical protein
MKKPKIQKSSYQSVIVGGFAVFNKKNKEKHCRQQDAGTTQHHQQGPFGCIHLVQQQVFENNQQQSGA